MHVDDEFIVLLYYYWLSCDVFEVKLFVSFVGLEFFKMLSYLEIFHG